MVFDPFHVMQLMNDKLDRLRRELWNNAQAESKVFVKTRAGFFELKVKSLHQCSEKLVNTR